MRLEQSLKMKSKKTNLTHIVDGMIMITLEGKNITAEVRQGEFLGSQITGDSDSMTDVNKRLTTAGSTTTKMKNVWRDKEMSLKLKRDETKVASYYAPYKCKAGTLSLLTMPPHLFLCEPHVLCVKAKQVEYRCC